MNPFDTPALIITMLYIHCIEFVIMPWQKNIITDSSNGCQMFMVRVGPFKIGFQPFGTKCSRVASIASQSPRKRHLDNLCWTISIQLWHLQIHYRTLTGHDAITIYAWLHIFKYLNLHTLNLSWIWFNQRPWSQKYKKHKYIAHFQYIWIFPP